MRKKVESLLFITNKPLTIKQLADFCETGTAEVETVLAVLKKEYNEGEKGMRLLEHNGKFQLVTDKSCAGVVEKFLKEELTGEMTRPQLEALTIIAYRGPITKLELEQIRGVNCSLILRNLMMRGLVEAEFDKKISATIYNVTTDFVRFLGLTEIKQLPDYERLSQHETLEKLLNREQEIINNKVTNI